MGTRTVHRVRIKHPTDRNLHVDVEVTDALTFIGPDGNEMVLDFSLTERPSPLIVDKVGAGLGVSSSKPTRISHIEKIRRPDDSTQELFIEVLDTVSVTGPNGYQIVFKMPSATSSGSIEDRAGLGITGPTSSLTRRGHTVKVTSKTDPDKTDYIGVVTLDKISYAAPNGQEIVLDISTYQTIDKTKYTIDSNGNAAPPVNSDANPYVKFPTGSTSPWVQTGETHKGVAQGMLWRIVATNVSNEPWWIWTPQYQPYEWSNCGHHGYIGPDYWTTTYYGYPIYTDYYGPDQLSTWLRLPNSGRSYSDSSGGPGPYLPMQGFLTADDAADYAHDVNPGAMVKMNFTAPPTKRIQHTGTGWNPNVWQLTGLAEQQPFHLDKITRKKVYDPPDADLAKQVATTFDLMWNQTTNNYNGYEIGMNGSAGPSSGVRWHDSGGSPFYVPLNDQFPGPSTDWAWAVAITEGETDEPEVIGRWDHPNNNFDFAGGLPANGWALSHTIVHGGDYGYRLWIFHPTTATPIKVTQLDPTIWNTKNDTPVRWKPKET